MGRALVPLPDSAARGVGACVDGLNDQPIRLAVWGPDTHTSVTALSSVWSTSHHPSLEFFQFLADRVLVACRLRSRTKVRQAVPVGVHEQLAHGFANPPKPTPGLEPGTPSLRVS
jgi:hypothetical protein